MNFGGMSEPRYWPRSESRYNLNVTWWKTGVSHRDCDALVLRSTQRLEIYLGTM